MLEYTLLMTSMKIHSQVRVNKELKLITYAEHWATAGCLLDRAAREKRGSYHQYLACITFTAFTLEAFLNHIGEELFEDWRDDLEQISVKGKMRIISDKLGLKVDYGEAPWQVVPELVAFRNKVAHGKNERLFEELILPLSKDDEHLNKFLKSNWQEAATMENAKRLRNLVQDLCLKIWTASGLSEVTLFAHGSQSGSASTDI